MIPKSATIKVQCKIPIEKIISSSYEEYLEREGFSDSEIENKIEETIRLSLWDLIPDNKIQVEFN